MSVSRPLHKTLICRPVVSLKQSLIKVWSSEKEATNWKQTIQFNSAFNRPLTLVSFQVCDLYVSKKRKKKSVSYGKLQNGNVEIYKTAHWQVLLTESLKLLKQIASFLEGRKHRADLTYWAYSTTWLQLRRKPAIAITFMNLKASIVRSLHIQHSDPLLKYKSIELSSDDIFYSITPGDLYTNLFSMQIKQMLQSFF